MIAAPGAAAIVFGVLYGELFGPTQGAADAVARRRSTSPTRLLAVAIVGGWLAARGQPPDRRSSTAGARAARDLR